MKVQYWFLAILSVMNVSCQDVGIHPGVAEEGPIFPLKVGNTWNYAVILYDSTGMEIQRWNEQRSVTADTVIDGEKWYYVPDVLSYLTSRPDGLWQRIPVSPYLSSSPGLQDPQLFLPFPITVGSSVIARHNETYTLVDDDVEVVVPAGTFSCYEYRVAQLHSNEELHHFYAPGVGLIRMTWSFPQGSGAFFQSGERSLVKTKFR